MKLMIIYNMNKNLLDDTWMYKTAIEFRISLGAPIRLTVNLIKVLALLAKDVKISD